MLVYFILTVLTYSVKGHAEQALESACAATRCYFSRVRNASHEGQGERYTIG